MPTTSQGAALQRITFENTSKQVCWHLIRVCTISDGIRPASCNKCRNKATTKSSDVSDSEQVALRTILCRIYEWLSVVNSLLVSFACRSVDRIVCNAFSSALRGPWLTHPQSIERHLWCPPAIMDFLWWTPAVGFSWVQGP